MQIVLKKSGDFYYAEHLQARIVAATLGVTLQKTKDGLDYVGLPSHSISDRIDELVAENHDVVFTKDVRNG